MDIYSKILEACPCGKTHRPETRTIHVGNNIPNGVEVLIPEKYPSNRIISSKYTAWNFLPKNIFEQFHRIANFYFLCVAIIGLLIDSPVSPWTSIVPLIFVVAVTAVKQGYEDVLRHRSDREVNDRPAEVVRDGKLVKIKAQDIQVGDVVRVAANDPIPCDMVMLSSADPEGECYITTANLDGETNLKTFNCIPRTRALQSEQEIDTFRATIECEQPIIDLYNFKGNMHCYVTDRNNHLLYHSNNSVCSNGGPVSLSQSYDSTLDVHKSVDQLIPQSQSSASLSSIRKTSDSLGPEHVLLRGSRLKNTEFVYGCAIYTGPETKVSLNSKYQSHKYSRIEKKTNWFLVAFLVILTVYSAIWTGLKYAFYQREKNSPDNMWYIDKENDMKFVVALEEFLSFMILCNYVIPISMYVTIELQKFFGSMFFGWDVEMFDAQTNEPAKANTSDLNEELGQVEYLFTDKTGTLTENNMQFRQCSITGQKYAEVGGLLCRGPDVEGAQPTPLPVLTGEVLEFFRVLAVCHTVRVDRHGSATSERCLNGMDYDYQASSPDEKAFVEAARRYGMVYHGVRDDNVEVTCRGQMYRYRVHHTLEFDPTRKRMSLIVQDHDEHYWLLCKGAETAILERVSNSEFASIIDSHINDFAVLGLRTLAISQRQLTEEEFLHFDKIITDAKHDIKNRKAKLAAAYDEVERDLLLLGATAVEDNLQEGVPETLTALQEAGIKVWVLTGDKEETAVNISYSAGHFTRDMEVLSLTKHSTQDECEQTLIEYLNVVEAAMKERPRARKLALVVDGMSLAHTLTHHHDLLQQVCCQVATVLCCRMSPLQKAEVVKLMKNSPDNPTTAAIGDGANDVSMIQEAHVGIGIMGKEGRQAVRSSDYAFGRFKFIRRALLVHGHYFYHRLATLVQYFFYKNVAMITSQLYFTFFSAFSAQTVYEGYLLACFNITFTSLPVLIYAVFELHLPEDALQNSSSMYLVIRKNANLSWSRFLLWNALGLWHSIVFFFGTYLALSPGNPSLAEGKEMGVYEYGAVIMTTCVITVNIKLMLESYYWNGVVFFGFILTFVGYFALGFIYQSFTWDFLLTEFTFYRSLEAVFGSVYLWLLMLVLSVLALLPDIILKVYRDNFSLLYRNTHKSHKVAPRLPSRRCNRSRRSDLTPLDDDDDDDDGGDEGVWSCNNNLDEVSGIDNPVFMVEGHGLPSQGHDKFPGRLEAGQGGVRGCNRLHATTEI